MSEVASIATPTDTPAAVRLRWVVLGALAAYFACHVVLRVSLSNSLVLDEAEQVLVSQRLQWGYGAQPPLYSWLQTGVFQVLGLNLLALSAVKNLLLFTSFFLMFLTARRMSNSDLAGVAAAVSILFMPEISWEAQRDLTHSVLLLATCLLTLWAFARLVETPTPAWYLLFGATAGLGVLSKYNYPLLLVPLLIAAATMKAFRPVVFNWRMLPAIVACLAVLSGHLAWVISNPRGAVGEGSDFVKPNTWAGAGLVELITDSLRYVGPLLLGYIAFSFRGVFRRTPVERRWPWEQLMLRALLVGLVLLAIVILAARVTNLQGRWLQPLLIVAPLWLVLRVQDKLTLAGVRRMAIGGAVVGIAVIIALTIRTTRPSESKSARRPINAPYDRLAEQIRASGFTGGTIIAADKQIGGNLHLAFPGSRTVALTVNDLPPRESGDVLLVWNLDEGVGFYNELMRYSEHRWGPRSTWPPPHTAEAKMKYAKKSVMRLGYFILHRDGRATSTVSPATSNIAP